MRFHLEIFLSGAAAASALRKAGEREEGRRRESRELNYFVELEGEKVIDKVVPLHLAPSLHPLCSAVCARRGRSSVRLEPPQHLGRKGEGLSKSHSCLLPSPPYPGLGGRLSGEFWLKLRKWQLGVKTRLSIQRGRLTRRVDGFLEGASTECLRSGWRPP